MCVQTALASAQLSLASLARYNAAQFPEASMQSTSALLNSSAPQMSYKQSSHRNTSGAQMSFRALRTTSAAQVQTIGAQGGVSAGSLSSGSSSRRTYSASSSGVAGMATISLPALSITDKHLASAAHSLADEEAYSTTSRPRRVNGENDDENPDDPYINANHTPVGATPWLLFVLLSGIYVAFRLRPRRNQSAKS